MAQDEAARLAALVAALESDAGYATGRRAYPRTLDPADATLIASRLHDGVDDGTEARARKGELDGMRIACSAGCASCCDQLIMVWLPEAMRVAEHLAEPENAAAREAFLAAYPAWRERAGDVPARVAELTASGKVAEHTAALREYWMRQNRCAFNRDGLCSVYAARPNICRSYHALETSERCRADSEVPASYLAFVPLDDFLRRAARLNSAMHHALGGGRGKTVALCDEVYRLLTQR